MQNVFNEILNAKCVQKNYVKCEKFLKMLDVKSVRNKMLNAKHV